VRAFAAAVVLLGAAACVPPEGAAGVGSASDASHGNVESARELDQEGVRAFRAGRYTDAIAYFRAAYRLGGPPSELWNIVRAREGMDDAEGAASAIDEYLAQPGLAAQDRADGDREAQALRGRTSALTVTTSPPGASVLVDGKPAPGATPLSTELRPGPHAIAVRRQGYAEETRSVEARFGRAVIVTLDLDRTTK
jgi:PEGA domain-containing protein